MRAQPVAKDYHIWEPGITFAESNNRLEAYLADKKAYREEVDAYAREHGCDKLSKQKLKALLTGNLIQSTGGKTLLKWRWQEYCAGRPVLRSRNYLKETAPPEHTLLKPDPGVGFLGLPLDVWYHHIFKFMDDETLIACMFLTRQLQARAHVALTLRAKARFGVGGTPMALIRMYHSRKRCGSTDYFHELFFKTRHEPDACVRICLAEYGCMEHVRGLKRFREEQAVIKEMDHEQERQISEVVATAINFACPEHLKIEIVGRCQCEFTNKILCEYRAGFHWTVRTKLERYLDQCRYLIGSGETNPDKIRKALKRYYPSDPFFDVAIHWNLPKNIDGLQFFGLIYELYDTRGLEWLKNLSIICNREEFKPEEACRVYFIVEEEDVYIRKSDFISHENVRHDLGLKPYGGYAFRKSLNAFLKTYKKIKA